MQTPYIKIIRVPYEEPNCLQLLWDVTNGDVSVKFEVYCDVSFLTDIASRLKEFPRHSSDVFLREIGSEAA